MLNFLTSKTFVVANVNMNTSEEIASNLNAVRFKIEENGKTSGRSAQSVSLLAVTKTLSEEKIRPALEAGHQDFAENRIQESQLKWPALREEYPDTKLHLIGSLQTNKVKTSLELFDVIHTLDRPSLAKALSQEISKKGVSPECFVQVNTGEEEQKGGVLPADADKFIQGCITDFGLSVVGLMCIPPVGQEPSPHFLFLKNIAERNGLKKLSMGMSSDYELAVRLGATHVRVGTAIFGSRSL